MAIYEGEIFIWKILKRNFKKCEKQRQLGWMHKMNTELSRKSDIKSYSLDNLTKHFYIYSKCELKLFSPKISKKCTYRILGGFFFTFLIVFWLRDFLPKDSISSTYLAPNRIDRVQAHQRVYSWRKGQGRWLLKAYQPPWNLNYRYFDVNIIIKMLFLSTSLNIYLYTYQYEENVLKIEK